MERNPVMTVLPTEHHYVRYCKPTQMQDGRVLPSAFSLRDREDGLSGDHFEHFQSNHYQHIVEALQKRGFTPKPSGCFVKLRCGEVIETLQNHCAVSFDKEDDTKSHTLLRGLEGQNEHIRLLLTQVIAETVNVTRLTTASKNTEKRL
jgi:hypothetical protein